MYYIEFYLTDQEYHSRGSPSIDYV